MTTRARAREGGRHPAAFLPAHNMQRCQKSGGSLQWRGGVPPVGDEQTLGTLLGGRPLPLGYWVWVMIPRSVRTILAQVNGGRKTRPGSHIQFARRDPRMRSVTNLPCLGRIAHTA